MGSASKFVLDSTDALYTIAYGAVAVYKPNEVSSDNSGFILVAAPRCYLGTPLRVQEWETFVDG